MEMDSKLINPLISLISKNVVDSLKARKVAKNIKAYFIPEEKSQVNEYLMDFSVNRYDNSAKKYEEILIRVILMISHKNIPFVIYSISIYKPNTNKPISQYLDDKEVMLKKINESSNQMNLYVSKMVSKVNELWDANFSGISKKTKESFNIPQLPESLVNEIAKNSMYQLVSIINTQYHEIAKIEVKNNQMATIYPFYKEEMRYPREFFINIEIFPKNKKEFLALLQYKAPESRNIKSKYKSINVSLKFLDEKKRSLDIRPLITKILEILDKEFFIAAA